MDKALASGACDVSSILAGGANIKYDLNDMSTPDSNIDGVFAKNLFSAKDFSGELKKTLPGKIYRLLRKVGHIADDNNVRVYLAGGFVRDLISGGRNFDMDIVAEGDAITFAPVLARQLKATLQLYPRFKTATLKLQDDLRIDLASARTEYYAHAGALPEVRLSSLRDDLCRRDFTINTLAVSLNKKFFGKLVDFFNGQKDIKDKKIKVLHDLSFIEDPTRIFRAVRLEQRLGFRIDKHTKSLLKAAVDLKMFDRLSKGRIADELKLLLSEPSPAKVIRRMEQLHKLKFLHSRIKYNRRMKNYLVSAQKILHWHKTNLPQYPIQGWLVYLLAITDELKFRAAGEFYAGLGLKRSECRCLMSCKRYGKEAIASLQKVKLSCPSKIYKILKPLSEEAVLFLAVKYGERNLREFFMKFLKKYAKIKLRITGDDIKKLNLRPGPEFRNILEYILWAKIDGQVKSKKDELALAGKYISRLRN